VGHAPGQGAKSERQSRGTGLPEKGGRFDPDAGMQIPLVLSSDRLGLRSRRRLVSWRGTSASSC